MPISKQPVLVTGVTGFVAAELTRQLLQSGYSVRGTTRDIEKAIVEGHLLDLPGADERLELFEADLLEANAYHELAKGCEYIHHTASPFVFDVEDPQRDLIEPAVQGTLSVLDAAAEAGSVKRTVLTSSFAAVAGGPEGGRTFTEADWNQTSSLTNSPYNYSKTLAERAAWDFMSERDPSYDLIAINPVGVIGPSIVSRLNQTHQFFVGVTNGQYPGVIHFDFPFVDVRDVAKAHVLAMETPEASGRYIASAGNLTFRQLLDLARAEGYHERYKLPSLPLDNKLGSALIRFAANFQPKGTRDFLKSAVGQRFVADTSKIREELGLEFRDLGETFVETMADLEAWGHFDD